jgi:hypothetical protein
LLTIITSTIQFLICILKRAAKFQKFHDISELKISIFIIIIRI